MVLSALRGELAEANCCEDGLVMSDNGSSRAYAVVDGIADLTTDSKLGCETAVKDYATGCHETSKDEFGAPDVRDAECDVPSRVIVPVDGYTALTEIIVDGLVATAIKNSHCDDETLIITMPCLGKS